MGLPRFHVERRWLSQTFARKPDRPNASRAPEGIARG